MFFSFEEHVLSVRSWESKTAMAASLAECDGHILLGEDAEQQAEFYAVMISMHYSAKKVSEIGPFDNFAIGVISQILGLKPHLLMIPERSKLLLGFNSQVVIFDVMRPDTYMSVSLNFSPFRSFFRLDSSELILVFHEIGVLALDFNGDVHWKHDRGVITDAMLIKEVLRLEFMDEAPMSIDIKTGALIELG